MGAARLYFNITSKSIAFKFFLQDSNLPIGVETVTFPVPRNLWTRDRNRRFFVSATDGTTTKQTTAVLLQGHFLRWNDPLDGLWGTFVHGRIINSWFFSYISIVTSSSQLTLNIFEEHGFRDDKLLSTFIVPYEMLRSSGNGLFLSSLLYACNKLTFGRIFNSKC